MTKNGVPTSVPGSCAGKLCRELCRGKLKLFRVSESRGFLAKKSSESAGLFDLTFIRREFYKSEVKDSCPEKKRVSTEKSKSRQKKNHVVGPVL